jgi:hypothetical protein
MSTRRRLLSGGTIATVVVVALLGALIAFSYHITAELDANLKAAGINPAALQPDHQVQPTPPRG